ncbi:alpha/beta fold hydrolase [Tardiphaga sp. 813_E8_N1_3]|uniref:alpha/beta hydrolase n=1 Tax=Tardiphaga sp. 813_E8_N1_3 TaxID=3240760 RepID=UPI003F25F2B0
MSAVIDLEAEYNNRAKVPESSALIAGWAQGAQAYRDSGAPMRVIPYGSGARHAVDYFPGEDKGPIVVFIHGGYWQALDRSYFSHLARGLNGHGISVAIPSYDLCPNVSVGDIIGQMRAATRELAKLGRRLVVSGHSAGGHLAACMLATDWRALDSALPQDLIVGAYAISGLFDLAPLVPTSINNALHLNDAGAREVSPLFWRVPSRGSLDAVVGGDEGVEYLRQSQSIVDAWGVHIPARFEALPGANHFTAVAPLADPQSAMVLRLKALATL